MLKLKVVPTMPKVGNLSLVAWIQKALHEFILQNYLFLKKYIYFYLFFKLKIFFLYYMVGMICWRGL